MKKNYVRLHHRGDDLSAAARVHDFLLFRVLSVLRVHDCGPDHAQVDGEMTRKGFKRSSDNFIFQRERLSTVDDDRGLHHGVVKR